MGKMKVLCGRHYDIEKIESTSTIVYVINLTIQKIEAAKFRLHVHYQKSFGNPRWGIWNDEKQGIH